MRVIKRRSKDWNRYFLLLITNLSSSLFQGYVVVPQDKRFLLLFTFLKKNQKKKMMVFFSSCMAVKYYNELLNYIDIPVLSIHVRARHSHGSDRKPLRRLSRANKSKRNERTLSSNSAVRRRVFSSARMWPHVVWIFLRSIGLCNSILPMIRRNTSIESVEPLVLVPTVMPC